MFCRNLKNNLGFTLIEMMIAVFASLVIALAVLTVFNVQHNQSIVQQGIGEMDSNMRIALSLMDKGVNAAGYQFREDNGVIAMNPRLGFMQWDGDPANDDIDTNPITGEIGTWATTPALPNIKDDTDAFVVTTPFSMPNPNNGGAVESVCTNATAVIVGAPGSYSAGATYEVCNPGGFASGCILLNNLLVADGGWWAAPTPPAQPINGSSTEPTLLVQYVAGGSLRTNTLAINTVTYNAVPVTCPAGSPSITFAGTGRGLQITPQADPGFAGPGGPVTLSMVSSYLYYLSDTNQLIRVPAGHDNTTHVLIPNNVALIDDAEDLQLQFRDNNGLIVETVDDALFGLVGGLDPDADGFKNTQSIAAIRIGLVGRTQLKEGLSKSAVLKQQPLFNHVPASPPVDQFHRRIVMRTSSADNLRF